MKYLVLYDTDTGEGMGKITSQVGISLALREIGVRFERWDATAVLTPQSTHTEIMTAYSADIERLKAEGPYTTVDVVSVHKDTENHAQIRKKFLDEHTHSEDEVRFFVEGRGIFYLHVGGIIYTAFCEQGDLLSVPAGIKHWFDMGPVPHLKCIRFFQNEEGWQARFTGDNVANSIPRFDQVEAQHVG